METKITRPTVTLLPPASHFPDELSPSAQAIATAKYHELIMKLGGDLSYESGWRGTVAKKLGISGSLLSQILTGRKVTRGTLEKAIVTLKLSADYFGTHEALRTVPSTMVPPAMTDGAALGGQTLGGPIIVDPTIVLEAYRALPLDTRRRVMAMMRIIDAESGGMVSS